MATMSLYSSSKSFRIVRQLSANAAVSGSTNPSRPPGRNFWSASARNDAAIPA